MLEKGVCYEQPSFSTYVHQVFIIFIHSTYAPLPYHTTTSLLPTLPFMSPINTILLPLSISIRHSFTSFPKLYFSLFRFSHLRVHTHIPLHISLFPHSRLSILSWTPSIHVPLRMSSHILGNVRSAHPSLIFIIYSTPHHSSFHPLPNFIFTPQGDEMVAAL